MKSSSDPDEVTMVASTQVIDKVQLPLLTNAKALKAGEQLVVLKPSEENQEAAASGSAPQAKKRKTTKCSELGFCVQATYFCLAGVENELHALLSKHCS